MYVAAYLAISMQYKESSHKAKHHGSALNMFQVSTCFNQQLVVFPKKSRNHSHRPTNCYVSQLLMTTFSITSSGTSAFTEAQTSGKEPQPVPGAEAQRRYPVMDPQRTQLRMGKSPKKCTKRYWILVVYPIQCGDIPVAYLIFGGTQEGLDPKLLFSCHTH